jgi:ribosomal-protein-alanine N-acetyltransferase
VAQVAVKGTLSRSHSVIRVAGAAAAPLIAALCETCFQSAESGDLWDSPSVARLLGLPGGFALLAEAAAGAATPQPAGFVMARVAADEAEIIAFGVVPGLRRRGHGRRLLAATGAQAAVLGARRLLLEVAADNDAALALYRDEGFVAVGRRRAYYRRATGSEMDAVILARRLA